MATVQKTESALLKKVWDIANVLSAAGVGFTDYITHLNSTHAVVSPMLHRIEICRNLILQQTGNHLDVLNDPAFLRYKKYFD